MKHRHKIKLLHLLKQTHNLSEIIELGDFLLQELDKIQETVYTINGVDIILGKIMSLKDSIRTSLELCSGVIPESEWNDFMFYGNFTQLFNEVLEDLYDLANCEVFDNGIKYKFILIE